MKAAVIEDFGALEKIHIQEVPVPTPASHEVKIEVHSVAANPVEWKIVAGVLKDVLPHKFPLILGWDVAGVVSEVGADVTNLSVGDEVYAYCRGAVVQQGTYAEYVCFDAQHVTLKPKNLTFAQAAAIPLVGLTAWQALFNVASLSAGQSCLIHAGAGGVGSMALQFAKWAGATVYTTASTRNHDYVKSLGADVAIDYSTESFVDRINELAPDGVDFVFDCVGGETTHASFVCVKKGGWLVSIVSAVDQQLAQQRHINATNVMVRANGDQLRKITELIEAGNVVCPHIEEMAFDDVIPALEKIKTEHTCGKIVLKVK